jgi:DNA-binding XRE family transcriptional regulator
MTCCSERELPCLATCGAVSKMIVCHLLVCHLKDCNGMPIANPSPPDSTAEFRAERARYLKLFGANICRLRMATSPILSQDALSDRARLHRTEIGKLEQGQVEPRLTTLVILADALGVTIDDLVAGLWVPVMRRPSPRVRHRP